MSFLKSHKIILFSYKFAFLPGISHATCSSINKGIKYIAIKIIDEISN